MLLTIIGKEFREVRRDPCVCVVLVTYGAILTLSCLTSLWTQTANVAAQASRQRHAREEWLSQTTNSPHQATHHGTTVYKLPSPLASVDPGVDPQLGAAVRLEAHRRHEATGASGKDQLRFLQLDFTTPALLTQAVLPLVIILVAHGTVSREREQGTWRLMASLGVSPRQAVLGKSLAVFFLSALLSFPVLATLSWIVITTHAEMGMTLPVVFSRAAAIYALNLLYLAGWCAGGVALSARCSSGVSLIVLISCWAAWVLMVPRLAVDLSYSRFPLPSERTLAETRSTALRQGSDGLHSLQEFNAALEQRLLQEYGVQRLEDLPFDLKAARLLAGEEFTDALDDRIQQQISDIYRAQNRYLDGFAVLSPYLTIRSVSTAFAGTDRHHHDAFVAVAERYRRTLVQKMNTAEMTGERPGKSTESSRGFWERVPEFQQQFPRPITVLHSVSWPIGILVVWSLALTIMALRSPRGTAA